LKVNYGFERAQRKHAKDLKKQEKLRRREEERAKRKALKEGQSGGVSGSVSSVSSDSGGAHDGEARPPGGPLKTGDE
jgi:hypothetical protein